MNSNPSKNCNPSNFRSNYAYADSSQAGSKGDALASKVAKIVSPIFSLIDRFFAFLRLLLFDIRPPDKSKYSIVTETWNDPDEDARVEILVRGFFYPKDYYASKMKEHNLKPKEKVVLIDPNRGAVCMGASVHFLEQSLKVQDKERTDHLCNEFKNGVPLRGVLYQNIYRSCEYDSSSFDLSSLLNHGIKEYSENNYIATLVSAIQKDPTISNESLLGMIPEKKGGVHLDILLSRFKEFITYGSKGNNPNLKDFFIILNKKGEILTDKQGDLVDDLIFWGLMLEGEEQRVDVFRSWYELLKPIWADTDFVRSNDEFALDLARLKPDPTFVNSELSEKTFLDLLEPDRLQDGHYLLSFDTHDSKGEVRGSHATALVVEGNTCLFYDPNFYIISFKKKDIREVLEYQFQPYHGHKPSSSIQQKLAWCRNRVSGRSNFSLVKESESRIFFSRVQLSTSHPSHPDHYKNLKVKSSIS
ncbi:MAG: hypothetical protein K940chlam9_00398 [Chlamydiae bacterium]|nr:hypothetical protein [Chlamydiota bacterium]